MAPELSNVDMYEILDMKSLDKILNYITKSNEKKRKRKYILLNYINNSLKDEKLYIFFIIPKIDF